ncbi:MAG TPA: hypothetical protein VFB73_17700 [Chloroflexota bacterium]|nr:hypothetical protein [Chloroflexota bacterium]
MPEIRSALRSGPWTVARLQRIGSWGRADEALGRRWEQVGLEALAAFLERPRPLGTRTYLPKRIVAFVDDAEVQRELQAAGLPNPDACLVGVLSTGGGALQPVDFKWSLDRAELPQVAAATFTRLLAAGLPALQARLAAAQAQLGLAESTLEPVDGFFFAPEHAENRAFLASAANARAEFPLTPSDVVFWPVEDPQAFFAPLPGWELGCWLAELDRSTGLLQTVEGAERYFRLGAGFAGALVRLATPLFATAPATVDARAELLALRARHRLYTSADLASYLERQMAAREALERELRALEESLYPFRQFRADLAATVAEANSEDGASRSLRERYRAVRAAIHARICQEGRALVAAGQSEALALATLRAQAPALSRLARALAHEALGTPGA